MFQVTESLFQQSACEAVTDHSMLKTYRSMLRSLWMETDDGQKARFATYGWSSLRDEEQSSVLPWLPIGLVLSI